MESAVSMLEGEKKEVAFREGELPVELYGEGVVRCGRTMWFFCFTLSGRSERACMGQRHPKQEREKKKNRSFHEL